MELIKFRKKIDDIDNQMFMLLKKRFDITDLVMQYKDSNRIKKFDETREKEILSRAESVDRRVEKIYKYILDVSKEE